MVYELRLEGRTEALHMPKGTECTRKRNSKYQVLEAEPRGKARLSAE